MRLVDGVVLANSAAMRDVATFMKLAVAEWFNIITINLAGCLLQPG